MFAAKRAFLALGLLLLACQRRAPPSPLQPGGDAAPTAASHVERDAAARPLAWGAAEIRPALSIVHATHGDGGTLARRATAIDAVRARVPFVLVLHAGELTGERAAERSFAQAALVRMGAHAYTPGVRDLGRNPAALAKAPVPVVLSNVVDRRGRSPFLPHRLISLGPFKIGVVGVLSPGAPMQAGWRVQEPSELVRASVASLRGAGAQLVLVLVAGGDGRALAGLPGVDGVVGEGGGGTFEQVQGAQGPVWLTSSGENDARLGRVDLFAGGDRGLRAQDRSGPLDPATPAQLGVALLATVAGGEPKGMRSKSPPPEDWTYGSSGVCSFCHPEETAQWKSTTHAAALKTLETSKRGQRPADDPACLGCHLTGFLQPGGSRYMATAKTYFAGVGCESCHGPSTNHVRASDKKTGTMRQVPAEVCLGCHTPDEAAPMDLERDVKKILGPGHGL